MTAQPDNRIMLCASEETHISLGIMNVHHEQFGRGVARSLLNTITNRGRAEGKSVRLVSSCLNLDSYSSTHVAVSSPSTHLPRHDDPSTGSRSPPHPPPDGIVIREAMMDDVEAMAAVEMEVSGISRRSDYKYFLRNEEGFWHTSVVEGANGLEGFLVSCGSEMCNMFRPGVAQGEDQAALIHAELNQHKAGAPLSLCL